jgi:hypothetical protein
MQLESGSKRGNIMPVVDVGVWQVAQLLLMANLLVRDLLCMLGYDITCCIPCRAALQSRQLYDVELCSCPSYLCWIAIVVS